LSINNSLSSRTPSLVREGLSTPRHSTLEGPRPRGPSTRTRECSSLEGPRPGPESARHSRALDQDQRVLVAATLLADAAAVRDAMSAWPLQASAHQTHQTSSPRAGSVYEGRCKATWKREFKLPWREAGPPNHHDDKVDLGCRDCRCRHLRINPSGLSILFHKCGLKFQPLESAGHVAAVCDVIIDLRHVTRVTTTAQEAISGMDNAGVFFFFFLTLVTGP